MAYKQRQTATTTTPALLQIPVDVDLIRFEKNLLQIGFFGSHDTRHRTATTRRIEQLVSRGGQRIKVAAEFRSSALLGLPSTADRDKFLAFMKIAGEERARTGKLTNTGSEVAHRVAPMLATVRRSNRAGGFPAHGFHEDSLFRDAMEGIN